MGASRLGVTKRHTARETPGPGNGMKLDTGLGPGRCARTKAAGSGAAGPRSGIEPGPAPGGKLLEIAYPGARSLLSLRVGMGQR